MPGRELDLLAKYPRAKRDPAARADVKTPEDIAIARQFGREFFDGERRHGYGGYTYSAERWRGVVDDIVERYWPFSSVLDVGCAKGFMLEEFARQFPTMRLSGVDISSYAIEAAPPGIKPCLSLGDARKLPFAGSAFGLAISINTIHNLDRAGCIKALQELQRVGRRCYVTVDAYRTDEDRQRMMDWNLTAQTILHVDEWLKLFREAGYDGDYGWWMP